MFVDELEISNQKKLDIQRPSDALGEVNILSIAIYYEDGMKKQWKNFLLLLLWYFTFPFELLVSPFQKKNNKENELLRIEKENLKFINMARRYIIIIEKKLGIKDWHKYVSGKSRKERFKWNFGILVDNLDSEKVGKNTAEMQMLLSL